MGNVCSCICERKSVGYSCIAVLFILGLACIIQLFFVGQAVDNAFNQGIDDQIIMTKAQQDAMTDEYKDWISNRDEDAPIQLFEYWIYNITNPYDVPKGVDPIFDLIGPFSFRRYEDRENVEFYETEDLYQEYGDDPIVKFDYIYEFEYLEEESVDIPLEAQVFTMSGAMQGLFGNINGPLGFFIPACVLDELSTWPGVAAFFNGPISDLIYGFRDEYVEFKLNEACDGNPTWDQIKPNTFFSLLPDGDNQVYQHTGKNNRNRVGELIQFRNWTEPEVNSWKLGGGKLWCIDPDQVVGPCHNEYVEGSRETRQFPPRDVINENSELIVWSIEKFRKTVYTFQKTVTFKGVELMRFVLNDKELKGCEYTYNTACSENPTPSPSDAPSIPSISPTIRPSMEPTTETQIPSPNPSISPTILSQQPSLSPTFEPTGSTLSPSLEPTLEPTTMSPSTISPTISPSTISPTIITINPTNVPTMEPTLDTIAPTSAPSQAPTCQYLIDESHTCKYFQFWQDEEGNFVDGIANLTNLRGSPSFMSKGRFLDAPYFIENIVNRFEGLDEPIEEEDDQYFDIDPKTGIIFRNYHNYQMNFEFYPLNTNRPNNFTDFNITGLLLPFVYIRVEAIATDDQMEFYLDTLNQIDLIKGFSLYGGPALAVVFFGLMFFILCKMRQSSARADLEYGRLVENNNNHNDQNKTAGVDISMQKSELNANTNGNGYGTIK